MKLVKDIVTDELQLSERAVEIDVRTQAAEMREIIKALKDTMRAKGLSSLSAPAIGYNRRIFCIDFKDSEIKTFINPIIAQAKGMQLSIEKCVCIPDKEFHIEKESIEIQFNPEEYTDGDNIHYLTNAFYDWLGEDLYDRFSGFFYLMNLMVERQRYKEKIKDRKFKEQFPLPNEIEEKQKLTISDILSNIAHWIGRIFNKTISWINENPGKIIIGVFYICLSFVAVCKSGKDITDLVIVSIPFVMIIPFLFDPYH